MALTDIPLSQSLTGKAWLAQFSAPADAAAAAKLLDAMLLLNDAEIADAIRNGIDSIANKRFGRRRAVALYAEREFDAATVYEVEEVADIAGRIRKRAVRYTGPVKPTRGKVRVGSEGAVAYLISQLVEKWPGVLKNHPGPNGIRAKTSPVGSIVVVTDLIGTGTRLDRMLDKFWEVPSVRSWVSRKWIKFEVVAAAGTASGIAKVGAHRLCPDVIVEHIVPTIDTWKDRSLGDQWRQLVSQYGPEKGRGGVDRGGFEDNAALVALSSRIPNNTPAIIHQSDGAKWRALYHGSAPADLRPQFRMLSAEEMVQSAAASIGIELADDLSLDNKKMVIFLSSTSALLRRRDVFAIAESVAMPVNQVRLTLQRAIQDGLLTSAGRLTDAGQEVLKANGRRDRTKATIATNTDPYYPQKLRIPRVRF
ncbi:hypothetical protein NKI46_02775 [Mesorhizobium sp. M0615]|uniref:phosphoribosyltransferase-like protein n=1 Tax=Mesorhizobium sp. M0615 TaxID=2956971 RepID=UPI00333654C3